MATPTLTTTLSTICNGEATDTGTWSGGKSSAYVTTADAGEAVLHGTGSRAYIVNQASTYDLLYTETAAIGLAAGDTLRIWIMMADFQRIQTEANNGMSIFVGDGSNTAYYTVYGSDTYPGGWVQLRLVIGSTPTSGTAPTPANIDRFGVQVVCTSIGKNTNTVWIDVCRYGNEISAYGGTSSDSFGISEIEAVDKTNAYGVIERKNGVYLLSGELVVGDSASTNDAYFDSVGEIIICPNEPWSDSSYFKLSATGNTTGTTSIDITGDFIRALGDRVTIDFTDSNISSLTVSGTSFGGCATIDFAAGQTIENCPFDNCQQIDPSTSSFISNTISNYVGTTGALLFPSDDSNIEKISFVNCDNGIEYGSTSDSTSPSFDAITFDDVSGNYDVNNTSGSSVSISLNNGSNANSYNPGGSVVTFIGVSVTTQITVKDLSTGANIENARVLLEVSSSAAGFPYQDSVSITGLSNFATVLHTAHGLSTGDYVVIRGAADNEYNGVYSITVTGANTYTYTASNPLDPSASATSTFAFISGLTNSSGIISDTRQVSADQPVTGWVRKASASPYYQQGSITGTVSNSSGFNATIQIARDE